MGIAVLTWGFVNPQIDMGIPISKQIDVSFDSLYQNGYHSVDMGIPMLKGSFVNKAGGTVSPSRYDGPEC